MAPFYNDQQHFVPYRGNKNVLKPNRKKIMIHQLRVQRTSIDENRDFPLQLHVVEAGFSERFAAYSGVSKSQSDL